LKRAFEDLKLQSEFIQQQNEEISEQNEEILKQKEQIEEHRDNLELKVEERTQELTRAKQELEIAYSLKSAFLQNMSHEIRTPLNAIIGFTNLIVGNKLNQTNLADVLKIIEQNSNSLNKVVDDILYISQLQTGEILVQFNDVDIIPMLNELYSNFSNMKTQEGKEQIEIIMDIPTDKSQMEIETDAFALKQILWNLISNGVKYTEEGSVCFGFKIVEHTDQLEHKEFIEFFVKDTGIGIPKQDLNKIYELFRKIEAPDAAKLYRGIGLGLSISEKLVKHIGGTINVSSQVGKGTTFVVSFPVKRRAV
jgi:signal transduction histidine kinase